MAQNLTGIPRPSVRSGSTNAGAGPTPIGATVPTAPGATGWHPTVVNLLVILAVEITAFAALRYLFRKVA